MRDESETGIESAVCFDQIINVGVFPTAIQELSNIATLSTFKIAIDYLCPRIKGAGGAGRQGEPVKFRDLRGFHEKSKHEPKPMMAARFQAEAREVLAKRSGKRSRFLDVALAKGSDFEPIGRLAG